MPSLTQTAREDASHVGVLVQHATAQARDPEILRGQRIRRLRLEVQKTHVPLTDAAHEAGAPIDADRPPVGESQRPRVEETVVPAQPVLEVRRPLLEEAPLLGKEEREPRQVHLLVVGLHLSEVRVDRDVQGEVGREADPGVHTALADIVGAPQVLCSGRAQGMRVARSGQRVRRDVGGGAARLDPLEHDLPHEGGPLIGVAAELG